MATITETLRPPATSIGIIGWLRKNLFSTWFNALLTLVVLWLVYFGARALLEYVTTGNWRVVAVNIRLFMVGRYPVEHLWRVQAIVSVFAFLFGASWGAWRGIARLVTAAFAVFFVVIALFPIEETTRQWIALNAALIGVGYVVGHLIPSDRWLKIGWGLSFPIGLYLLYGGGPLPAVATDQWGGLLLTFSLAIIGIAASFPLGVLLALGRQSSYPVMRTFCILYIEIIRGVPLVTILFMAQIMFPLFLPEGITVERVVRAMLGLTFFTAAYLAETVRGGLQSVGSGQTDAARALGLGSFHTLQFIVLPQALRTVIPAIVGQFISLFKDTSLVAIVGLLDLAGIGQSVVNQKDFLGTQREVYLFIAAIYFIFASTMSYASRRLERKLSVGER